ncbi:MAG: SDR family NAD(P)-dependent oxidoreductase [Pseudomonadota bacterium]
MKAIFEDKVCVVTGAGSGIGQALALDLGSRGARLAISDINPKGLAETADALESKGVTVHSSLLNVADQNAIYAYAKAVTTHFGDVHQLYNNAGISGMGSLLEMSPDEIQAVVDINLMGVIHCSKAFMPVLERSGAGTIVNLSSLNGFAGTPGLSIYSATKFGVRGFSDALRADAMLGGSSLKIVCVHPGGIRTNIAKPNFEKLHQFSEDEAAVKRRQLELYDQKLLNYPASRAAADILDGVAAGKDRIVITKEAKLLDWLTRLLPVSYLKLLNWSYPADLRHESRQVPQQQ